MSITNQFTNPYDALPPDRLYRTSILLDRMVQVQLIQMNSRRGVLQTTVSVLLGKLLDSLQKAHLEGTYDPDRFEEAVANCTINLGGSNGQQPAPEPTKPAAKRSRAKN